MNVHYSCVRLVCVYAWCAISLDWEGLAGRQRDSDCVWCVLLADSMVGVQGVTTSANHHTCVSLECRTKPHPLSHTVPLTLYQQLYLQTHLQYYCLQFRPLYHTMWVS